MKFPVQIGQIFVAQKLPNVTAADIGKCRERENIFLHATFEV